MKKRKSFKIYSLLISILALNLSSCSFDDLISDLVGQFESVNSENNVEPGYFHNDDCGNSLEIINNAFNSSIDVNHNQLKNKDLFTSSNNANKTHISKNAKSLEYNAGLPSSIGQIKGLVIPVDFYDYPVDNTTYTSTLPTYQSVSSYYYNSSYGKLDISFDILDWYRLSKPSSYYAKVTDKKYHSDVPGVATIIHEVLAALEGKLDLSKYDQDNDGYIDCIHVIYNHPIDHRNADFWWAYQYFNYDFDHKYNKVSPYAYVFSALDFIIDEDDNCNARTLIHETAHMFGLEDYYDYDTSKGFNRGGLGGYDMMDSTFGEHNPFSKMALGWIDYVYIPDFSNKNKVDITIDSYEKNGDTILVPIEDFDINKGIFQSYYLIQFLNPRSLLLNNEYIRINNLGVRVYEVNAQLANKLVDGHSYEYYKYDNSYTDLNIINAINNNSVSEYYRKIEYNSICASNKDLFHYFEGYSLPRCNVSFIVSSIDSNTLKCKITLYKN